MLLKAIICAKKEGNNNSFILDSEKLGEIQETVQKVKEEFEKKGLSNSEIAWELYYGYLLNKQISKAITAQWFAYIIQNKSKEVKQLLLEDENVKYLIEAIKYVTGGNIAT